MHYNVEEKNLKEIMPSIGSWSQKATCCMYDSIHRKSRQRTLQRQKGDQRWLRVGNRGHGDRRTRRAAEGYRASL